MTFLQSGGNIGRSLTSFGVGFIAGVVSTWGAGWTIAAAAAATFASNMLGGESFMTSARRALVSAGIAGGGVWSRAAIWRY